MLKISNVLLLIQRHFQRYNLLYNSTQIFNHSNLPLERIFSSKFKKLLPGQLQINKSRFTISVSYPILNKEKSL